MFYARIVLSATFSLLTPSFADMAFMIVIMTIGWHVLLLISIAN